MQTSLTVQHGICRNEILLCDGAGCDVAVHQQCFGLTRVPRGKWFCDACTDKLDLSKPNCVCCPVTGGVLRKVGAMHCSLIFCLWYLQEHYCVRKGCSPLSTRLQYKVLHLCMTTVLTVSSTSSTCRVCCKPGLHYNIRCEPTNVHVKICCIPAMNVSLPANNSMRAGALHIVLHCI